MNMKVQDYFERESKQQKESSRYITDPKVFDFVYIPEEPLMREEAKRIINACLRYQMTGISNNLLVFGARGSGKTLLVRYITEKLLGKRHGTQVLYANCRQFNTSTKLLAHWLKRSSKSLTAGELWDRLSKGCQERTVFVLDEVDLWSEKDKGKDLLYLISRSRKPFTVIMLTNNPEFNVDESTHSTLQPEVIHFRDYDALQIQQILGQRARIGLRRPFRAEINKIAAMTAREVNSDMRVAIKTLYYLATQPKEDLRKIFDQARKDLVSEVLVHLNKRLLLILQATAEIRKSVDPLAKAVFQRYCELCRKEHDEPSSYVHFYSNLSYLQSLGMILLTRTKVGRTYTKTIDLLFEPNLAELVYRSRFGM